MKSYLLAAAMLFLTALGLQAQVATTDSLAAADDKQECGKLAFVFRVLHIQFVYVVHHIFLEI